MGSGSRVGGWAKTITLALITVLAFLTLGAASASAEDLQFRFDHGLVDLGEAAGLDALAEGEEVSLNADFNTGNGQVTVPAGQVDIPPQRFEYAGIAGSISMSVEGQGLVGTWEPANGKLTLNGQFAATVDLDQGGSCQTGATLTFSTDGAQPYSGQPFSAGPEGPGAIAASWNDLSPLTGGTDCDFLSTLISGSGGIWLSHDIVPPPSAPISLTAPVMEGSGILGSTLTCTPGEWEHADSLAYRWTRDGEPFENLGPGGVPLGIYQVLATDVGSSIACHPVASNLRGTTVGPLSNSVPATLPPAPVNVSPPAMGYGSTREPVTEIWAGARLYCNPGQWTGATRVSREWLKDGKVFENLNPAGTVVSTSYKTEPRETGSKISCRETATNAFGSVTAEAAPALLTGPSTDPADYPPELPVLHVNTAGRKTVENKVDYHAAAMALDPNGHEVDPYVGTLNIRGRGNSTWNQPKKPYRLKLSQKDGFFGMPASRDWVLLANWFDRSQMRNSIAFFLGDQTSLEWTPGGRHVALILNGDYQGTYTLTEKIEIEKTRVDIEELSSQDTSGESVTGGYVMELDGRLKDGMSDDDYGFRTTRDIPMVFKEPKAVPDDPQFEYMRNYVQAFEDALYAEDFAETHEYTRYIDLDSFIDAYLVNEFTMNYDAGFSSLYFFKPRGGKLRMGPLWDYDRSMGSNGPNSVGNPGQPTSWRVRNTTPWISRLFQDPQFRQRIALRWNMLKSRFAQAEGFIQAVNGEVAVEQDNDERRWEYSMAELYTAPFLIDWLPRRTDWLNSNLANTEIGSQGLLINEVNCSGTDWVELYNPTSRSISLGGLALTDLRLDQLAPGDSEHRYVLPDEEIPSNGYFVVQRDESGVNGFEFGISCDENVVLTDPSVGGLIVEPNRPHAGDFILDRARLDGQDTGVEAFARTPDRGGSWGWQGSTRGRDNTAEPDPPPDPDPVADGVVINEVNCSATDWIELYNPTDADLDISGWVVTDDPLDRVPPRADHRYVYPQGTVVPAGGYLVVQEDGSGQNGFQYGISCDDTISLGDPENGLVDRIVLTAQGGGSQTFARVPDGGASWVWQASTRGTANSSGEDPDPDPDPDPVGPIATHMVVNEVNCSGTDWVELFNPTDVDVDVSGWVLTDDPLDRVPPRADHRFVYPESSVVSAGGFLVVEQDGSGQNGFQYGISCDDTISLGDLEGELVDRIVLTNLASSGLETFARVEDGRTPWVWQAATRGSSNSDSGLSELVVERLGDGSGSVSSDPGPESGGYMAGTLIALVAVPDADSVFEGWSGCDWVINRICLVEMTDADRVVGARFDLRRFQLGLDQAVVTLGDLGEVSVLPESDALAASFDGIASVSDNGRPGSAADTFDLKIPSDTALLPTVTGDFGSISFSAAGDHLAGSWTTHGKVTVQGPVRVNMTLATDEGELACFANTRLRLRSDQRALYDGARFAAGLEGPGALAAYWDDLGGLRGDAGCAAAGADLTGPGGMRLARSAEITD